MFFLYVLAMQKQKSNKKYGEFNCERFVERLHFVSATETPMTFCDIFIWECLVNSPNFFFRCTHVVEALYETSLIKLVAVLTCFLIGYSNSTQTFFFPWRFFS